MLQDLKFYTSPEYEDIAHRFIELYEPYRVIACPSEPLPIKIPTTRRVCRFCNKRNPFATFKSAAHIIPESLGNRYLTSEFECDKCNHKFGDLDSHLMNFIGVQRSLNGTVGKKKTKKPQFYSADKKVKVTHAPYFADQNATNIELSKQGNGSLSYDKDTSEFSLKFVKQPYKPLFVYQSLIKIALSVMPSEDIQYYQDLIRFITTDKKHTEFNVQGAMLSGYLCHINSGHPTPYVFLFKKRHQDNNIPTHISILYCRNLMLEIKLPLHSLDRFNKTGEEIKVMDCPPFFLRPYEEHNTPYCHFRRDLSDSNTVKMEEDIFKFRMDFSKGVKKYDPETGTISSVELEPDTIKGLRITSAQIPIGVTK